MKSALVIIAILAAAAAGAWMGYGAGHRAGVEEGRASARLPEAFDDPSTEDDAAGASSPPPWEAEEPDRGGEAAGEPRPGGADPAGEPPSAGSPVAEMTTYDADGAELGRHPAAPIRLPGDHPALLTTLLAVSDARSARVTLGGRTGRVSRVLLRSPGRGLAVVACDVVGRGTPVAAAPPALGAAWYAFPGDADLRPTRIDGEEAFDARPDTSVVGLRLDFRAPGRGAVLFDESRHVAGIVTTRPSAGTGRAMALPVVRDQLTVYEPVDLTLAEYHALYFEGSVEALVREARKRLAEEHFDAAVSVFRTVVQREPSRFESVAADFRAAHVGRLRELPLATRAEARFEWLAGAAADFPSDAPFLLDLAETAARVERWEVALSSWEQAWRVDPGVLADLDAALARTYLAWGDTHEKRGLRDAALDVYERGVRHVPGSAELWRAYGLLLIKARDYAAAAGALREAVAVDPRLSGELDPVIARAERLSEGPGKVVIDYPPGSRSIVTRVAINGAVGDFIIDTGATSSFVTESIAAAAGLDTSHRVPRRIVRTAGGERELPYSPVGEIRLGDLAVDGISVIVGDLPGLGNRGLLGMDFLGAFGFENDSANGRFVIYEKQ